MMRGSRSQIFTGKVEDIWRGNGAGQYLPSDEIPKFQPPPPNVPQGQYAVKIVLDDSDPSRFPIGAEGAAAVYTSGGHGAWAALRKISMHAHSWYNWLYPINFLTVREGPAVPVIAIVNGGRRRA
jgi:hypothetical protein